MKIQEISIKKRPKGTSKINNNLTCCMEKQGSEEQDKVNMQYNPPVDRYFTLKTLWAWRRV
jgi:hypothetical protein